MKVLFLDTQNGHSYKDPIADLVEIKATEYIDMHSLEFKQLGVMRTGGCWEFIMEKGNIEYTRISHGNKSDYKPTDYDFTYTLISGNY